MRTVESEMSTTFVGIVGEVDVCNLGEEGAWVFCKWMEGQTVDDYCKDLENGQLQLMISDRVVLT
jgi:hypothetical protein